MLVEQKSAGRDFVKAKQQALDYFPNLKDYELPRYILVSDFQTFELYDLDEGEEVRFPLADLPKHVEAFGFILGIQKRTFKDQDPVNIAASELMGPLHDALKESGLPVISWNGSWCGCSFVSLPTIPGSSNRGGSSWSSCSTERGKTEAIPGCG